MTYLYWVGSSLPSHTKAPGLAILLTAISGACALIGLARATDAIGIHLKGVQGGRVQREGK